MKLKNAITDVRGLEVRHAQDEEAETGCTVILCRKGAVAGVDVRGRAKKVFDFEYLWEVYKPAHLRRWGYYTLPILYGDDRIARLDPKLDRKTNTLQILGFWLEDEAFASTLANGLQRFAGMIGAQKFDLNGIKPAKLRSF